MKKELELKLMNDYPSFFRDMYGDPRKTCMAWGCSHGDGWFDLLNGLCRKLAVEAEKDPETNFKFLQIKEKFARLTLYTSGGNKVMNELVRDAENKSETICEECGNPGSLDDSKFWLLTLCEECKVKRER